MYLILAVSAACGSIASRTQAGDLVADHGLVPDSEAEASNNSVKMVDAIKTGAVLTCERGGSFWFDGPLRLTPAYRRNNTAYEIGDRVRADFTRIYKCVKAGTTGTSAGPTGTGLQIVDGSTPNEAKWDYVAEVTTGSQYDIPWNKFGLNIRGPNSQHSPQALEEYQYPQTRQLRFIVKLDANSDAWMNLDDEQAPASWEKNNPYFIGAVIAGNTNPLANNQNNLYVCVLGGTSANIDTGGPTGTGASIVDGGARWTWIGAKRILTNVNLQNFILQIQGPKPWQASRNYRVGDMVKVGANNYICDQNGLSAPSGGPSGTGQDILDNGARWDYTKLGGCGSGIKIGVPRQAQDWISARGVRIDGVYITAPEQVYAKPIDVGTQVLSVSQSYGLRCNFVYDLDASNCAVRGFATGWDLYQCDLPHISYLHGLHSYRTLRHVSHPDNSARPGTYSKVTVEGNPGNAIELDSGLLVEAEVENGYPTTHQAGEFALPAATTWSIGMGLEVISMTGAANFLQPGMAVRLDLTPAAWAQNTSYAAGALISNTVSGVTWQYICISGGMSASSGTGPSGNGAGTDIPDGGTGLTWRWAPWLGEKPERIVIIKDVAANQATFWNHLTQSYNSTAIPVRSGATFKRLMGVGVVGRTSRFSMRDPSLELNTLTANLPLAVLQPGTETLYVDATVNEKGLIAPSNAYAIAANCAGYEQLNAVIPSFGVVQCSGRFLAPNHPLAVVFGAPASGLNHLRTVGTADQWGVGPEACYNDDNEGRIPFRMVDAQWTRYLDEHATIGWRVPIAVPTVGVKELRYRILCKNHGPSSRTLSISCGYFNDGAGGDDSGLKAHTVQPGWQIIEGSLPPDVGDASLPLDPGRRNYLRLHKTLVNVARVEAYPAYWGSRAVTPPAPAQSITAAGNTITPNGALHIITNSTAGSLTLTSAPTMPDGVDGERVTLLLTGNQNIVLQDQAQLANSNLRTTSTMSITLTPRDSIEFTYSAAIGDWVQTGALVAIP